MPQAPPVNPLRSPIRSPVVTESAGPPDPFAPTFTSPPVIAGFPYVGETLSCSTGSVSAYPAPTFSYQWTNNGSDIIGETASTYVPVGGDVGDDIGCDVEADNGVGSPATDSADPVEVVAAFTLGGSPATTGDVGGVYSFTPTPAGGVAPYGPYSLSGSVGASGLSFDTGTGELSAAVLGPADTYGPFTISGVDDNGFPASVTPFSIVVSDTGPPVDALFAGTPAFSSPILQVI